MPWTPAPTSPWRTTGQSLLFRAPSRSSAQSAATRATPWTPASTCPWRLTTPTPCTRPCSASPSVSERGDSPPYLPARPALCCPPRCGPPLSLPPLPCQARSRSQQVHKLLSYEIDPWVGAGEVLDGGNKYKCPKQKRGVRAVKRMTVDAAPNVLMIQLKRFEFSLSGHKISKKVGGSSEREKGQGLFLPVGALESRRWVGAARESEKGQGLGFGVEACSCSSSRALRAVPAGALDQSR